MSCFLIQPMSVSVKLFDQHSLSRFLNKWIPVLHFLPNLTLQVCNSVTSFCKVLPRWLCLNITLGTITMFWHSLIECSYCHSNILTFWKVWTVLMDTFSVVNTVFSVTADRVQNCVSVAGVLADNLSTVWEGGTDWAGFPTPFQPGAGCPENIILIIILFV